MSAPKVCIFTETYYPVVGGGETQAQLLAEGLIAYGFSVILLTRRSDASLKEVEQYGDITVHRLGPVGGGQLKKWGLLLSSVPALIKLRHQYDLIFVSGYRIVGISAVLLAKLLGKTLVLKADSQGEMSGDIFKNGLARIKMKPTSLPFRLLLGLRNKIIQGADSFTAISTEIADEMISNGINPRSMYRIPNSVNTDRFRPVKPQNKEVIRRLLDLPPEHKIAIYTGRLVSYKGLPLLLEVWHKIQNNHPNVTLLLLGTGGLDIHNCEAELKDYVKRNNLQKTVRFTGAVLNVEDYLQAADFFVFPTEDDALPSSLIEAMACRLPVVTTPVGAMKSIIISGQNGIIVSPKNFDQLYDALELVIKEPELGFEMGRAGWHTVQENYSAKITTKKYVELFTLLTREGEVADKPGQLRAPGNKKSITVEQQK
jgi:glycosyltransferase involved in cell wall biosynthesis